MGDSQNTPLSGASGFKVGCWARQEWGLVKVTAQPVVLKLQGLTFPGMLCLELLLELGGVG